MGIVHQVSAMIIKTVQALPCLATPTKFVNNFVDNMFAKLEERAAGSHNPVTR
jgi:hypothetical protein